MKHLIKKRYASLLIVVLLLFGIITALTGCMNEDSTNDVYQSDIKEVIDINKLSSIKIVPYQYYREKDSRNSKYNHIIKYEEKAINLDIK